MNVDTAGSWSTSAVQYPSRLKRQADNANKGCEGTGSHRGIVDHEIGLTSMGEAASRAFVGQHLERIAASELEP